MVTLINVPRYVALLKNYASKPTLTKWLGVDGERVEDGQPLVVVETSKTSLEIECMSSGILFIFREVGEKVNIGDTLGAIADSRVEMDAFRSLLMDYPWERPPKQSMGTTDRP
jgi:pyruvate/2-oxoglutarate dehydrogenase complex dihydrolipoamide acyltransferase (E2) component